MSNAHEAARKQESESRKQEELERIRVAEKKGLVISLKKDQTDKEREEHRKAEDIELARLKTEKKKYLQHM